MLKDVFQAIASSGHGTVREVALPSAARRLSSLASIDYNDAFLVEGGLAEDQTPEQRARAILEEAPMRIRGALQSGWRALGLELGSADDHERILGWEVRRSTPEFAVLAGRSRIGFSAELLLKREGHSLLFATLLQYENAAARPVWAAIAPGHRRVVRYVLEQSTRD